MKQAFKSMINSCIKRLLIFTLLVISFPSFAIDQEDAVNIVRERMGGKVLDIRTDQEDNKPVYLVKVITRDSRVITVKVDSATGDIL
ncbi:MAG TPA: hypothetical protein DHW71_05230 [Gammaproteobacteria bacterium]|nr:hypothetical protein [Gammaproteobacteria bacterium]MEC8011713.1 PepSY domain-containing protein [Pseudomonadota bacterium]HBF07880.1 hypothetical protein [Gammaproteobacteria bacterium]HCK92365.1 hypothetical protein [Gammaproteobacteria bacterium]|tara:strand:- start:228 stop:488 length:261 start_codon:yes stop_codon:yes gene_type:complete